MITASALSGLLQPAGVHAALYWAVRELTRFGVEEVVVPGAFEASVAAVTRPLPIPVAVAAGVITDKRVLVLERDRLFDLNLAALLAAAAKTPAETDVHRAIDRDGQYLGIAAVEHEAAERAIAGEALGDGVAIVVTGHTVGSEADLRRPALLLDRDGTINVDHGYVGSRDRFAWIQGARAAIRRATEAGWHVFIVTNQSGVARGLYEERAVRDLHAWLMDEVRRDGGTIDDVRYCPHHPEGTVASYRQVSPWRKPEPGMILDLIARWGLDPARCLMVGDQPSDMGAAAAAGIAGHLFAGADLDEFVAPLLRVQRKAHGPTLAAV